MTIADIADEVTAGPAPGEDLVRKLAASLGNQANVQIAPHAIPEHIAKNLLEFLRRVQSTGMEAVAWVEAYQFVQQLVPQQPGVPFGGLPPK
jgi:hypothetical protein